MKHIALVLALLIFAFSLVSCGDLTYYKGAGWSCKQEEFYEKHYESTGNKLVDIAAKNGINAIREGGRDSDGHFVIVVYDDKFTCYFQFSCEEHWGRIIADLYFYGADESEVDNYSAQKKYVDYLNEVLQTLAYDMDPDVNILEDAYNNCIDESKTSYEQVLAKDYMTGGASYGVYLGIEKNVGNHTMRSDSGIDYKSNYYRFEGLISGNFDGPHDA